MELFGLGGSARDERDAARYTWFLERTGINSGLDLNEGEPDIGL